MTKVQIELVITENAQLKEKLPIQNNTATKNY